jgi:hypothetical protein
LWRMLGEEEVVVEETVEQEELEPALVEEEE